MTTDTCICAQDTSERSTRGETAKRFDNGGEACSRSRPSERGALPRISESELLHHAPESPTQRLQFTYEVCVCVGGHVCVFVGQPRLRSTTFMTPTFHWFCRIIFIRAVSAMWVQLC
jgi:hypothetical protein